MVLAGSGLGFLTSPKSEVRSPEVLSTSGSAGNERRRRGGLPCKKGGCDLKISQEVARGSMTVRVPNHKVRNRAPCLLSQSNIQVPDPESDSSTVGQVGAPASPSPSSQVPSPESQVRKSQVRKSQVRNRLVRAAPALQSEVRKSEVRNRPPSSENPRPDVQSPKPCAKQEM